MVALESVCYTMVGPFHSLKSFHCNIQVKEGTLPYGICWTEHSSPP